jgi:hypothetical protein
VPVTRLAVAAHLELELVDVGLGSRVALADDDAMSLPV